MAALQQIIDGFLRWIDSVAVTIVATAGWLTSHYTVKLVEQEHGTFALKGSGRAEASIAGTDIRIVDGQVVGALPEKIAAMLRGSRAELVLKADRFLFRPLELPTRAGEFLEGIVRSQIDRLTPVPAMVEDLPEQGDVLLAAAKSAGAIEQSAAARAVLLRAQIAQIKQAAGAPR